MNILKKTLFLTNKQNNNKGISTLIFEKRNKTIFCTMKCYYNIPKDNLILGIQCKDKIIKQNISFENNPYNFILSQDIDLDEKISCVLISTNRNDFTPILWGSEKTDNYKIQIISTLKESINKLSQKQHQSVLDKQTLEPYENNKLEFIPTNNSPHQIPIVEEAQSYISTTPRMTPHEMNFDNIEDNQNNLEDNTSEVAVAQASLFEYTDDEVEKTIDENIKTTTTHNFYNMLSEQIDELFDKYPHEYTLEKLIDNSKWVKITYESNSKPYVVGLIFDGDDIKYICYGVPGKYDTPQPNELIGYSQWLPTDVNDPYNNGYWVMYQDADTGENILIE